jgi:cytidylate kinase
VKRLIVAIDGPSGAGKGTVARTLARTLQYRHIDTGAMYRAVAWKALHDQVALDDEDAIAHIAEVAPIELEGGRVAIDDHDVTTDIRTPTMDKAAAAVARLPRVRSVLVARQRQYGEGGGVVMEGRDIGTVVFPSADLKIYLDATADERARRRAADVAHTGGRESGLAGVQSDIVDRDRTDTTRAVAPLSVAEDAIYLDTTNMQIEDVVSRVMTLVEEKLGGAKRKA